MYTCIGLFYSLSWNVIHPDTKTNILMKSSLTKTVAKASSEWQLEYLTSRSGKKMITLKTDVNKEKPEFNIEVSRKEPFLSIFMCRSRGVRTPPEKITSGHVSLEILVHVLATQMEKYMFWSKGFLKHNA